MSEVKKKKVPGTMSAPPKEFWENELEVNTKRGHEELETPEKKREWVNKLTGREIEVLRIALAHEDRGSVRKNKDLIASTPD